MLHALHMTTPIYHSHLHSQQRAPCILSMRATLTCLMCCSHCITAAGRWHAGSSWRNTFARMQGAHRHGVQGALRHAAEAAGRLELDAGPAAGEALAAAAAAAVLLLCRLQPGYIMVQDVFLLQSGCSPAAVCARIALQLQDAGVQRSIPACVGQHKRSALCHILMVFVLRHTCNSK